MVILSSPSSSRSLFAATPRFSTPSLSPSPSFASVTRRTPSSCLKLKSSSRRLSCVAYSASGARGTAEMLEDAEESSAVPENPRSATFLDVATEEDLLHAIRKEAEGGRLPSHVARGMEELYYSYRNAVFQSGIPNPDDVVMQNMAVAFDLMFTDVKDPFQFSSYHRAIREPYDYYTFGQSYIRPLLDFRNSYVGNISVFYDMEEKLQQGDNIVLMSNHQTEADPAIIALLLETSNTYLGENMTYVAGDRVITDPLSKPFSMGRNLVCVYSKKHMDDDPKLVDMKKRANTRSLKQLALLLRGGSKIIWIAPSGGRDRPDPLTEEWFPAPFDPSSVDNMRRLIEHAGVPGHIYPLALLCHDIMPPPPEVQKEIGERRMMSFRGAGLSVAPEISFHEVAATFEDPEKAKMAYTQALYDSVSQQYDVLKSAVHEKRGLKASTPDISLSQPWETP